VFLVTAWNALPEISSAGDNSPSDTLSTSLPSAFRGLQLAWEQRQCTLAVAFAAASEDEACSVSFIRLWDPKKELKVCDSYSKSIQNLDI